MLKLWRKRQREHNNTMTQSQPPFSSRLALNLVSIFLLGWMIYLGKSILLPLFFSITLAMLLLPVVNWLNKKGIRDVIAIIIALLLFILFTVGILFFLSSQIAGFLEDLPQIKEKLGQHLVTAQEWISNNLNISVGKQEEAAEQAKQSMQSSGTGGLGVVLMGIGSMLVNIILLPIYTFLVLFYRKLIYKFFRGVFADRDRDKVEEVLTESQTIVNGYMAGLLLEMAIVVVLNTAGFLIIGIPYAIFLAVLAAILNLIPYIGMLIASVICMAVTLTGSDNISDVIWTGLILIVVQFIDNNFIMPYIVSSKVKINALVSIIGVLIGGALAGVGGMFLSIPGIAILKVVFDRVDGLKPWGLLLGDDAANNKGGKKGRGLKVQSK
jgi:predicted PurR-regulated permease PerM